MIGRGTRLHRAVAAMPVWVDAVSPGMDKARFKLQLRRFPDRHRDHTALLKLRRAEPLTPTDMTEPERIFAKGADPEDQGRAEVTAAGGLGPFPRSLMGLDRKTAKEAFGTFLRGRLLRGRSPTSAQGAFVDPVIDHLTEHGAVDPRRCYESPFADLDDQGSHGLFPDADIHEIITIVRRMEASARLAWSAMPTPSTGSRRSSLTRSGLIRAVKPPSRHGPAGLVRCIRREGYGRPQGA